MNRRLNWRWRYEQRSEDGGSADGNGKNPADVPLSDNDTFYFAVKDGVATSGSLQITVTHDAKNIGPGRYREIMVEVK